MEILRYAAFTDNPAGGNPAGVVLDATGLSDAEMQRIAADVGYSETAFLFPTGPNRAVVRYFAPLAEVDFCGHATIATSVALAERAGPGEYVLDSNAGPISVRSQPGAIGFMATLISVPPQLSDIDAGTVGELLAALRLTPADLDPALPIKAVYSGERFPIVGVSAAALDGLDQQQDRLAELMFRHGWRATVDVVHRIGAAEFVCRNPFPPGGVREDPATGAAAAAFGGYLRALGLVTPPARIVIHQGAHVDRPGTLAVDIPVDGGIAVTGGAVPIG